MTDHIVFALPENEPVARSLAQMLNIDVGQLETRKFPDGESYVRYATPVEGKAVILISSLDHPDDKFLPLIFSAAAAKEGGASSVGLLCPYLAYMRQDRQFKPGEAVTSEYFAKALTMWIDWLVTVDPHLHRRCCLDEIYSIPSVALHAASDIAKWIRSEISKPVLVGPDSESEQWVGAVAKQAGAPYIVLEKVRHGDRDVEVSVPDVKAWLGHTPVLVDDIISTARTMIETVEQLHRLGLRPPMCVGVHGLFANNAYEELREAGAARIVTCNTIRHPSNAIDMTELLASGVRRMWHNIISIDTDVS